MFCSDRYGTVVITTESIPEIQERRWQRRNSRQPARKRADGELSRERILDAATEIAAERGYEGTSIGARQQEMRPAGEFHLLAFQGQGRPDRRGHRAQFRQLALRVADPGRAGRARSGSTGMAVQTAKALLDSPDFIRLGLMLALERRPVEPRARTMFIQARARGVRPTGRNVIRDLMPELDRRRRPPAGHLCHRGRRRLVHRQGDRRRRGRPDRACSKCTAAPIYDTAPRMIDGRP